MVGPFLYDKWEAIEGTNHGKSMKDHDDDHFEGEETGEGKDVVSEPAKKLDKKTLKRKRGEWIMIHWYN